MKWTFFEGGETTSNRLHKFLIFTWISKPLIKTQLSDFHRKLPAGRWTTTKGCLFSSHLVHIISSEDQSTAETGEESPFHDPYTEEFFVLAPPHEMIIPLYWHVTSCHPSKWSPQPPVCSLPFSHVENVWLVKNGKKKNHVHFHKNRMTVVSLK